MSTTPRIIAHRGYSERYPENTLPALRAAVDAGTDAVELDVQMCLDGVPVVLHDADVERTTGQTGTVAELSLAELQALSAHEPNRLGARFEGTPIPSLAQAAQELAESDALVFVEIKQESVPHHAIPQTITAVLEACEPLGQRAIIISYDDTIVQAARSIGSTRIGWVISDWTMDSRDRLETIKPDFAFVDAATLPPAPAPLWEGPWEWAVYEINNWPQAAELGQRGVRWIETQAVETMVAGRSG